MLESASRLNSRARGRAGQGRRVAPARVARRHARRRGKRAGLARGAARPRRARGARVTHRESRDTVLRRLRFLLLYDKRQPQTSRALGVHAADAVPGRERLVFGARRTRRGTAGVGIGARPARGTASSLCSRRGERGLPCRARLARALEPEPQAALGACRPTPQVRAQRAPAPHHHTRRALGGAVGAHRVC